MEGLTLLLVGAVVYGLAWLRWREQQDEYVRREKEKLGDGRHGRRMGHEACAVPIDGSGQCLDG